MTESIMTWQYCTYSDIGSGTQFRGTYTNYINVSIHLHPKYPKSGFLSGSISKNSMESSSNQFVLS